MCNETLTLDARTIVLLSDALTFESTNYNARVFLAVAKLNLGKVDESEEAYKAAIDAQPKTLLAWQVRKTAYSTEPLSDYWKRVWRASTRKRSNGCNTSILRCELPIWRPKGRLIANGNGMTAHFLPPSNDVTKCAEALQKVLNARKEHGSRNEVLGTLKLFLPGSPYYNLLSELPSPDQTNPTASTTFEAESLIHNSLPILEELLREKEKAEQSAIQKEVEKRRQRLTTTTSAEDTRKAVMQEIMSKSELPGMYPQSLKADCMCDFAGMLRVSLSFKLRRRLLAL